MGNRCAKSTQKSTGVFKTIYRGKGLPTLTSFLKFLTGSSFISSLNDPKIKLEYLDESKVMLEAQ